MTPAEEMAFDVRSLLWQEIEKRGWHYWSAGGAYKDDMRTNLDLGDIQEAARRICVWQHVTPEIVSDVVDWLETKTQDYPHPFMNPDKGPEFFARMEELKNHG